MAGGLAQRALLLVIRGYRRFLSGRGPLRQVVCTFVGPVRAQRGVPAESCSAYGLRVAQSTGAWAALRLIRARLRRCHEASLYSHPAGLLFGTLYDDLLNPAGPLPADASLGQDAAVARLVRQLAAAQEQPAAVALILRSAAAVSRSCGDEARAACCLAAARHLSAAPSRFAVRDGRGLDRHLRRRRLRGLMLALCPLLGGLAWVAGCGDWGGVVGFVIGALAALAQAGAALGGYHRQQRRLRGLQAARAFALDFVPGPLRLDAQPVRIENSR